MEKSNLNNNWSKIEKYLLKSLILAIIPALGYVMSFTYELGYFSYFGLPDHLIKIDLMTIIVPSVFLFLILGLIAIILMMTYEAKESYKTKSIFPILIFNLSLFLYLYSFKLGIGWTLLISVAIILLMWIAPFLVKILYQKYVKGDVISKVTLIFILFSALFFFVVKAGLELGKFVASSDSNLVYVLHYQNKDFVLIRSYANEKILLEYSRKDKAFGKAVFVTEDLNNNILNIINIK